MNTKIKTCIRRNIPETNSSSCHSLSIFGGDIDKNSILEELELESALKDNGSTLVINGGMYFGRDDGDNYNDVYSKMQYVLASESPNKPSKRKTMFEKVIKDFLGVDKIEYNWYDKEEVDKWFDEHPDEAEKTDYYDCPLITNSDGLEENIVDHESFDLIEYAYETEDTLRDFIFSPNSWICCGECDVTPFKALYPEYSKNSPEFILSLIPDGKNIKMDPDFPGDRVDLSLFKFFPYSFDMINEVCSSWGRGKSENIYINIKGDNTQELINEIELQKLSSMYLKRVKDEWYLFLGQIPKNVLSSNIQVPIVDINTFKYPFTLKFRSLSSILNKVSDNSETSINLIPSTTNIEFNEYI